MRDGSYLYVSIRLFSAFVILFIMGCASGVYQLYDGPKLPMHEIAIISGHSPIMLYKVDGKSCPSGSIEYTNGMNLGTKYNTGWHDKFQIELLPGTHTINVGYYWTVDFFDYPTTPSNKPTVVGSYTFPQSITFEAKAGKTYHLIAVHLKENSIRIELKEYNTLELKDNYYDNTKIDLR